MVSEGQGNTAFQPNQILSANGADNLFQQLNDKARQFSLEITDEKREKLDAIHKSLGENLEALEAAKTPEEKEAALAKIDGNKTDLKGEIKEIVPPIMAGRVDAEIDQAFSDLTEGGEGGANRDGADRQKGFNLSQMLQQSPLLAMAMLLIGAVTGNQQLFDSASEALGITADEKQGKAGGKAEGKAESVEAPPAVDPNNREAAGGTVGGQTTETLTASATVNEPVYEAPKLGGTTTVSATVEFDPNQDASERARAGEGDGKKIDGGSIVVAGLGNIINMLGNFVAESGVPFGINDMGNSMQVFAQADGARIAAPNETPAVAGGVGGADRGVA